MTIRKETPDNGEKSEEGTDKEAPITSTSEKSPDNRLRPPISPRKNVIPQRRTSFEDSYRTPDVGRKSTLFANATHNAGLNHYPPLEQAPKTAADVLPNANETRQRESVHNLANAILPFTSSDALGNGHMADLPTTPLPLAKLLGSQRTGLTRVRAFLLMLLLVIIVIHATTTGFSSFFGPQGWGAIFNAPGSSGQNLLQRVQKQLHVPTPGATAHVTSPTPAQIVDQLMANMTLDEKLGQMIMVRFGTQYYSPELDAMLTQYHVGSVIEYAVNIGGKSQLIQLNTQIQHSGDLPVIVAIDQEGGTVDRLLNLDGPQPSAASLGATGDSNKAYQQGILDAKDLAGYGFNLNLAPVVDVTNVYNSQLAGRTYGNNAAIVTQMAGAYLKGLQQSGKVLGTIKHFPGLGDTSTDPHSGLPLLTRSLSALNAIDWAPYKSLLSQPNVYSIMVTHEIVTALDSSNPSSLSPKIIDILRNQLNFQGVIITDGLTMDAIMARYTLGQAAVMAVEAGDDLLMDPASPNDVAQMIDGLKQAISSGAISQQRVDDSVRRILLFKYQMGLIHL